MFVHPRLGQAVVATFTLPKFPKQHVYATITWVFDPVKLEVGVDHVSDASVGEFGGALVFATLPKVSKFTIKVPGASMGFEMLHPVCTTFEAFATNRALIRSRQWVGRHSRQGTFVTQHMVV